MIDDKSLTEICQLLQTHYKPKNLEVAGTYKFHSCIQTDVESIAEYSARLRRLAADCNFGTFLQRALRDHFVSGIRDENTKKKLLSQDSLTFEDAMKVSIADEAARRETQIFKKNSIRVMKYTSNRNGKNEIKRKNTSISLQGISRHFLSRLKLKSQIIHVSAVEELDI